MPEIAKLIFRYLMPGILMTHHGSSEITPKGIDFNLTDYPLIQISYFRGPQKISESPSWFGREIWSNIFGLNFSSFLCLSPLLIRMCQLNGLPIDT